MIAILVTFGILSVVTTALLASTSGGRTELVEIGTLVYERIKAMLTRNQTGV